MKTQTDSKLIFQYQNGDEKALSTLINRHKKDLFTFIYYKLMDEDLANDIFQDTFIRVIVTLKEGRYKEENKFILWAKRIAHNLIIDHFRLQSKNIKISETSFENTAELSTYLEKSKLQSKNVLLKASRGIALEKIVDFIQFSPRLHSE